MIIPIILSGGAGTRLWPLSRASYPKQFLTLFSKKSMIQQSVLRLQGIESSSPIVITNNKHRFVITEQFLKIGITNPCIILEPVQKNTAPAIVSAVLKSLEIDKNADIIVLPSDQIIEDTVKFQQSLMVAKNELEKDGGKGIFIFGITPNYAATGYGYIKQENKSKICSKVIKFVEKPEKKLAEKFVKSGEYLWNGGMLYFRAEFFISQIRNYYPEMIEYCKNSLESAVLDNNFIHLNKEFFNKNISISIDKALTERISDLKVVKLESDWNDVGSWFFLWKALKKDKNGNIIHGKVITEQVTNSFIYTGNKTVAVVGLDNIVVANTPDALLVCNKDKSQEVGDIVEALKLENNPVATQNIINYKPWGYSEKINDSPSYKVNKIIVNPHEKQSLHYHLNRSEHWIVLSGSAEVVFNKKHYIICKDESTFIPPNTVHQIINNEDSELEIIEIQTGMISDDDIIRIDDKYGRDK